MNVEKWERVSAEFACGSLVPANGWEAWAEIASRDALLIRDVIPDSVEMLLEVGCGIGRLTPYLATLFPFVVATDTAAGCRAVTAKRCEQHTNVLVLPPDEAEREDADAALVWCLYDTDWTLAAQAEHRHEMQRRYPIVLEGTPERWMLVEKPTDDPTNMRVRTYER